MITTSMLNEAATKVWGTDPMYLGLSTTTPAIDGTGVTEPIIDGNGYGRAKVTGLSTPVDGVITNTTDISMPRILKPSGTATYWVLFDSDTVGGGNLLAYGKMDESIQLSSRTDIKFEPGDLKLKAMNLPTA